MRTINLPKRGITLAIIVLLLGSLVIAAPAAALEEESALPQIKNKIKLNGVALKEALRSLAEMADLNVITDDSTVNGKVTARLQNMSVFKAFKLLVKSHGLDYKIIENTIIIGTEERLRKGFGRQVTRVYKLENASVEEVKTNLSLLVKEEEIQINQRSNQLMIKTYQSKFPEIEKAIEQLDKARRQVAIQVRLEEISKGDLEELGIDWSFSDLDLDTDDDATQNNTDDGDDEDSDSNGSIDIGSASLNYATILDLLAQNNQSSTLANPRLTTVDGEKATINIGESIPIVKEAEDSTEVEFKDVGINLEITPRITGEDEVYIHVIPEVSVVKEYLQASNTKYPVIGTRKAETSVRIKEGQTIAIGGLIKEEEVEKLSKVPFLGDLPILGELFKSRSQDNQKQELVIFLTPRIIDAQGAEKNNNDASDIIPTEYEVQPGDTLWEISQSFNVLFFKIIEHNDSEMIRNLEPGKQLKIPVPASYYYAVKPEDTLEKIAAKYHLKVDLIKKINDITTTDETDRLILPFAVGPEDRINN